QSKNAAAKKATNKNKTKTNKAKNNKTNTKSEAPATTTQNVAAVAENGSVEANGTSAATPLQNPLEKKIKTLKKKLVRVADLEAKQAVNKKKLDQNQKEVLGSKATLQEQLKL